LREPKTLHIFATHHAGDAELEKHWTDKVADRLRQVGGDFLGCSTEPVSVERFLRGVWGKGYLHWKNVLEQQLDLKCRPLSPREMWDYLYYRLNPLDSESIAVPQEIVMPDNGATREVIRSRRHGATLLMGVEPEYKREYVRLGDTYVGILTFWDKPGGWPDKRAQLHYLYNLVAHDVVTDTEIIVQLKAGNDKKLNWKLSRLTKQGLAKSNYRKSKGDLDVASDLKARLGEEAQLRVMMGETPLHVAVVILVRRKSLSELVESIISNGAKSGIRCIISAQSPDKIATSREGQQILSNINTKLVGKVVNSAVDNICSILKYPREMVLACAERFKMNPYHLYSQWLLEDDGKMSFCRYYVPYNHLGLVANNQDEQLVREDFERAYPDKFEAMSLFSKALVESIRSGKSLFEVAVNYLPEKNRPSNVIPLEAAS
jgi:hypothetical protein